MLFVQNKIRPQDQDSRMVSWANPIYRIKSIDLSIDCGTEGSPFTIRNHPVKTQTFDFLYIFACNTSQMQFPCNIRLSLAYNHDKQILSGFL